MLTQNELIAISTWSKPQLHSALLGRPLREALQMRRNLQEALTKYSKGKKYDDVQGNILAVIMQIERWARQGYVYNRLPKILSADWSYLKKGKASAKRKANEEFDLILKKHSY